MNKFSSINESAVRFVIPDQGSIQRNLRDALNFRPIRTNLTMPSFTDVRVLTKDDIQNFSSQKKGIANLCKTRENLSISALCITAAAVAALVLAFYFSPVILFAVAAGLAVAGITLIGFAICRHVQYNKKINQLAQSILPVVHQLALARQFSSIKSNPNRLIDEIGCKDLELLSISSYNSTEGTDFELIKKLIKFTEQKRKEGKIDDSILLLLFKSTASMLDSAKERATYVLHKYQSLVNPGAHPAIKKPVAPLLLKFYTEVLEELSSHPMPKELVPLFKSEVAVLLNRSQFMIRNGADLDQMILMFKWLNEKHLSVQKNLDYVKYLEKNDDSGFKKSVYVHTMGRFYQNQMKFIADGYQFIDAKNLYNMIGKKITEIIKTSSKLNTPTVTQVELQRVKTGSFQEIMLKKIKEDPNQKDAVINQLGQLLKNNYASVDDLEAALKNTFIG